eukprot:gene10308-biopygen12303
MKRDTLDLIALIVAAGPPRPDTLCGGAAGPGAEDRRIAGQTSEEAPYSTPSAPAGIPTAPGGYSNRSLHTMTYGRSGSMGTPSGVWGGRSLPYLPPQSFLPSHGTTLKAEEGGSPFAPPVIGLNNSTGASRRRVVSLNVRSGTWVFQPLPWMAPTVLNKKLYF